MKPEGAEEVGGSGSRESGQLSERASMLARNFASNWARSESVYADFLSGSIHSSDFETYMNICDDQLADLEKELKSSSKNDSSSVELLTLTKNARKEIAGYHKYGKSLLGQQMKESRGIFDKIAGASGNLIAATSTVERGAETAPEADQSSADSSEDARATRRGTSAGVEKELPRQRGRKKPVAEEAPAPEVAETAEVADEPVAPESAAVVAASKSVKDGLFGGTKPARFTPEEQAIRDQFRQTPESDEPSTVGKKKTNLKDLFGKKPSKHSPEEQAIRDQLKGAPKPVGEGSEEVGMTRADLKKLFAEAPVDPFSPDAIPAEIESELKKQIAGEQERLAAEGITAGEPPAAKVDTPRAARARLKEAAAMKEATAAFLTEKYPALKQSEEAAKSAYFAKLAEEQRARTYDDAIAERIGAKRANVDEGTDELKALKREWVQSRGASARARLEHVRNMREVREQDFAAAGKATRSDIETRQATAEIERNQANQLKWNAMSPKERAAYAKKTGLSGPKLSQRERGTDAVMARFERRYVLKEAVLKATQEEAAFRAKALNTRKGNPAEWALSAYNNLPPAAKLTVSSVFFGLGSVGAIGAMGAVGPVAALAMGAMLAGTGAGLGMRIAAEALRANADKDEKAGKHTQEIRKIRNIQAGLERGASWTSFAGWGGMLGGGLTKMFQKKARAQAEQNLMKRDSVGNVQVKVDWNDTEALAALARDYDKAQAILARENKFVGYGASVGGVVGSIGGGAAVGWGIAHQDEIVQGVSGLAKDASPFVSTGADKVGDFFDAGVEKVKDIKDIFDGKDAPAVDSAGKLKVEVDDGASASAGKTDASPTAKEPAAAGAEAKADAGADTKAAGAATSPAEKVAADTAKTDTVASDKTDAAAAAAARVERTVGGAQGPVVEGVAQPGTPEGLLTGATIHSPGEGFGEMIQDLKENFREQLGATIDKPSPALEYVLSSNPNAVTHAIGAADGGQSLTMQIGDQFAIDENQNIWFQPTGGEPHLVIENVPVSAEHPDGFVVHKLDTTGEMRVDGVVHAPKVVAESAPVAPSSASDVVISQGNEDVTVGDVTVSQSGGIAEGVGDVTVPEQLVDTSVDTGEGIKPLVQPENLDTTVPAEVAAPAPEQSPVEAPKAAAPVAEQVPVQAPKFEMVGTAHPFADPDAGPLLNPNGVDLNKPQILLNENRYWALGTSTEDSFERASALSAELAKQPGAAADSSLTNVYFVAREFNKLGVPYDVVKLVYTLPGSDPQIAGPEAPARMPDLPDAEKFKFPTKR